MDVEQQVDDVRLDDDHQKLDYGNFIYDDEVTLHHKKRDTDVTDIPGSDVRDEMDTQREDWLLRTESLHRARPRRTTKERPHGGYGPRGRGRSGRRSSRDSMLLCGHPSDRS